MSTQGLPPQGSQPPQLPPVPPRVRPTEGEAAEKKGVGGTASPASLQGRGVTVQTSSETTGTAGKVHEAARAKAPPPPVRSREGRRPLSPSVPSEAPVSGGRPIPPPRVQKLGPADSASRPDERVLIEGEGLKARAAEPSSSASATLSASAEKAKDIVQEVLPQTAAQPKEPVGFFGRILGKVESHLDSRTLQKFDTMKPEEQAAAFLKLQAKLPEEQAVSLFSRMKPAQQQGVFKSLPPALQKAITDEKVKLLKSVVEEFNKNKDKLDQEGLFRQESDVPVKAGEDLSKAEGKALAILYKKELRVLRDTGLPEGIITDDMMKIDLKTPEGRQQLANELNMPGNEQRKEIILGFLKLSGSITERSETNKMTASNIAIAVGPSLYRNEPDVMLAMARLEPESDFSNSILDNRGALIALLEPQSSPVQAGAPRDMPPRPARPDRPATPPTSASAPAPSVAAGTISRADFTTLSRDEKVGRFKDLSKEDQKTVFRNMSRGAPDLQRRIFSDMDTETRREFFNDLNVQIQGEFRAYL